MFSMSPRIPVHALHWQSREQVASELDDAAAAGVMRLVRLRVDQFSDSEPMECIVNMNCSVVNRVRRDFDIWRSKR